MLPAPANLFDPEFPRQFTRFSSAFSGFSRQASLILGSVRPSDPTRSRLATSALRIADSTLINEWLDFRQRFARICEDKLVPHFRQIEQAFRTLWSATCFIKESRSTDLMRVQALLCGLKDQIMEVRIRADCERFRDFDSVEFNERLREVVQIVNAAIDGAVGSSSEKALVISVGATVAAIMTAAEGFDVAAEALTVAVEQLHRELEEVHVRLRLPFEI